MLSLLLVESFSGRDYTWNIHDVNVIFIQKKQRPLLGFCVGGIVGGLIGYASYERGGMIDLSGFSAIGGGALGGLIGAGLCRLMIKDQKIQIEGKSEAEIEGILEYLRKKARMPDYN